MPERPLQHLNLPPYTQVLSALRKIDLLRLCIEFRLPNDGSVVQLRNRLKDYLNLNRDTLSRNPRYNALFPRHRRPYQPPPPTGPSSTLSSLSRSSSPTSARSHSSTPSFDSWHGIGHHPEDPNVQEVDLPHYLPPHPSLPPQSPQPHHRYPLLHPPSPPLEPYPFHPPPPSNHPTNSDRGSLPPANFPLPNIRE